MVLAGPRLLVVGTMTRHTATAGQNTDTGQQDALFGDPAPAATGPARCGSATVQDPELVADVVRTADAAGYLLVERSQRVVKADPANPGVVDSTSRHEQDAVLQLLDSGHLRTGGAHHVHHHGHEGPARSILVPKATREMITRWSHLRPVPAPRTTDPTPETSSASGRTRPKRQRPTPSPEPADRSGPIVVDVIRPGRGLLTCAEFGGQIIRDGSRYVVETEFGHVVGRASSYRLGAGLLARHHGYTPGPIEIDRREERDGNAAPRPSARDRQLGR